MLYFRSINIIGVTRGVELSFYNHLISKSLDIQICGYYYSNIETIKTIRKIDPAEGFELPIIEAHFCGCKRIVCSLFQCSCL